MGSQKSSDAKMVRDNFILEPELHAQLTRLCEKTTRNKTTVIRAVLRMFLGSGDAGLRRADQILSSGLWADLDLLANSGSVKTHNPTPEAIARHVVDGQPLSPAQRKRKSG